MKKKKSIFKIILSLLVLVYGVFIYIHPTSCKCVSIRYNESNKHYYYELEIKNYSPFILFNTHTTVCDGDEELLSMISFQEPVPWGNISFIQSSSIDAVAISKEGIEDEAFQQHLKSAKVLVTYSYLKKLRTETISVPDDVEFIVKTYTETE